MSKEAKRSQLPPALGMGEGGRGEAAEFQGGVLGGREGSLFRKGAPGELQIRWEGGGEVGKGAVRGRVWGVMKLSEPPAVPLGMPEDPLGMPAVQRGHGAPGSSECHKQAQNQGQRRGRKHALTGA